jgi:hypothetical protein
MSHNSETAHALASPAALPTAPFPKQRTSGPRCASWGGTFQPLPAVPIRTMVPAMQHMVRRISFVGVNGGLRTVLVSVPMAEALIDHVRYFPADAPPETPGARFHVTKPNPERLAQALAADQRPATPRAPSLRTMVRWALQAESAEALGKRLRQRWDRQHQARHRDEAELERLLGKQ